MSSSSFLRDRVRRARELFRSDSEPLVGADRALHWVAVLSCVFFAAVAFWESFGPQRSGHMSTSGAYSIAAENMVRWKIFGVVQAYVAKAPSTDLYYCHHPYGITMLQAIAYVVFGHHWFTTRAGAIFCSVITPPLIYAFGRRVWGIIPASVATVVFCFIPIALAFSNFSNLEEPTIAFGVLFAWATVRLWESWRTWYLILAAIGAFGCCNGDWAGFVFIGPVVTFAFFRAYVLPRGWYGRIDERMHARWFAYITAMAVGTLVLYLLLFGKVDKLGDLTGSYHLRSSGSEVPVAEALSQRRKLWLGMTLTPVAYGAMALGVPLALVRLVRKPFEIFTVSWFVAASFQYFVFKQGADIHIFWPHYYAPAAAFAAGTLTATLLAGRGWLISWVARIRASLSPSVAFASGVVLAIVLGIPLVLLARTGIPEIVQSRKTGGRFDHGGHYTSPDADMAQFAEWAYSNVGTAGSVAQALERYDFNFSSEYGVDRPYVRVNAITAAKPDDVQRIAVVDTRNQAPKDLEKIARDFGVQDVGPFWRVDRAAKGPAFTALRYVEREPNAIEWYLYAGTDLMRSISRDEDVFATWEWRDALGLPAPAPTAIPVTLEELRIAHNVAVQQKDVARAEELRARLAQRVGRPLGVGYSDGVRLLGVDVQRGPAIVVTLYWETSEAFKKTDVTYQVKCKILAPPPLWMPPVDYFEKDIAPTPPIRPGSWKPGYLYADRFVALHRIGKEECRGSFSGDLHVVTPGDPNPVLLTFD
jgi:hypothetical protein